MVTAGNLLRSALDVLYPPRCVGCGKFETWLCVACDAAMTPTSAGDRCPNCSARWSGGLNCPRCFACTSLDRMAGAFDMDGVARQLVHGLKYRGVSDLAALMASRMERFRAAEEFDVSIAVPLHRSRQRRRGFNQADEILRRLRWPRLDGALVRLRKTETQVGLHSSERRSNVSGAFAWRGDALTGRRIVLVDDVITTGATVNECARVLREHGARSVVAFAFARASHDPSPSAPIPD